MNEYLHFRKCVTLTDLETMLPLKKALQQDTCIGFQLTENNSNRMHRVQCPLEVEFPQLYANKEWHQVFNEKNSDIHYSPSLKTCMLAS